VSAKEDSAVSANVMPCRLLGMLNRRIPGFFSAGSVWRQRRDSMTARRVAPGLGKIKKNRALRARFHPWKNDPDFTLASCLLSRYISAANG
jgi:hypothetical protein